MDKKTLNLMLILGGAVLSFVSWGPAAKLIDNPFSPFNQILLIFFIPMGALLTAYGIINYSNLKWHWKALITIPIAFLIWWIIFIISIIIFGGGEFV